MIFAFVRFAILHCSKFSFQLLGDRMGERPEVIAPTDSHLSSQQMTMAWMKPNDKTATTESSVVGPTDMDITESPVIRAVPDPTPSLRLFDLTLGNQNMRSDGKSRDVDSWYYPTKSTGLSLSLGRSSKSPAAAAADPVRSRRSQSRPQWSPPSSPEVDAVLRAKAALLSTANSSTPPIEVLAVLKEITSIVSSTRPASSTAMSPLYGRWLSNG